jgi:hypothetical protein
MVKKLGHGASSGSLEHGSTDARKDHGNAAESWPRRAWRFPLAAGLATG